MQEDLSAVCGSVSVLIDSHLLQKQQLECRLCSTNAVLTYSSEKEKYLLRQQSQQMIAQMEGNLTCLAKLAALTGRAFVPSQPLGLPACVQA